MLTPFHPFAEHIGLEFEEVGDNTSLCSVVINEKLMNPQQVVHGGVLYALADTGMGGALYPSLEKGELCATIEIKIAYFQPVKAGKVTCRTTVTYRGKRVAHLESEIYAHGQLVAKATGSYSIFRTGGD